MTNTELAARCRDIAQNYKTLYVLGGFGAPATEANKQRWIKAYAYNARYDRKKRINAASRETFFFDCVGLIKAILWGWKGDKNQVYGGATYLANGVPDIGADAMISYCGNVSKDFNSIEIGEVVWLDGHIGVYIGDGLVVECSPKWADCVQITALGNMGTRKGYNTRAWTKHGKLPWISYNKSTDEIAREVIAGKWGVQPEREKLLTSAGYDYKKVQARVDEILDAINVLLGDVDGNGKVEPADARLALRAALGLEALTDKQKTAADYNKDGKIEPADARLILRKSLGLEG